MDLVEEQTKIPLRSGYGMTETTGVLCVSVYGITKPASVGTLVANMSAKLVDGELFVKGPNIMKGYLQNSKANKETFTDDGWMKTGDVCRIDEDGNVFVVDRIKEVSISCTVAQHGLNTQWHMYSAYQVQGLPGDNFTPQNTSLILTGITIRHRWHLQVSLGQRRNIQP